MTDPRVLLSNITALRERLDKTRRSLAPNGAIAVEDENKATLKWEGHREPMSAPDPVEQLQDKVNAGAVETVLLEQAVRQVAPVSSANEGAMPLPVKLTARAHQILERGRELVCRLRALANDVKAPDESGSPLMVTFRQTAGMAETALRIIQAFPEEAAAQIRLCGGLEGILGMIEERTAELTAALARDRKDSERLSRFAQLLLRLKAGDALDHAPFVSLAEEILTEARHGAPLRFLEACSEQTAGINPAARMAEFVAAHGLTVAQVAARTLRHDPEWRTRPVEAIAAALLCDSGMLEVPSDIVASGNALPDEHRRIIERHPFVGGEWTSRLFPEKHDIVAAVRGHHERLDGTGYPDGLRDAQINSLARLLAVCDVYAAMCVARPYRAAKETRTALTDTLLMAQDGTLDRYQAERLLHLSFYPVGCVVELSDGTVGVVVATHGGSNDLDSLSRPVLALLTDPRGQSLPGCAIVDLAQSGGASVVRSLTSSERRRVLGKGFLKAA